MPSKDRRKKEEKRKQRIARQATKTSAELEIDKIANKNNQERYRENLNEEDERLIKEKDASKHQTRRKNLTTPEKVELRNQNNSSRAKKRACLSDAEKKKIREEDLKRRELKLAMETPEHRRKRLESHYNSKVESRNNLDTSMATTNKTNFYFERQVSNLCGLHALNNLLQASIFTKEDLDKTARHLDKEERSLYNVRDRNSDQSGNYNITVLRMALERRNYIVNEVTTVMDELIASDDPGMFLITTNNHHYAVRRFAQGEPLYVFDSLLTKPLVENLFWIKFKQNLSCGSTGLSNVYQIYHDIEPFDSDASLTLDHDFSQIDMDVSQPGNNGLNKTPSEDNMASTNSDEHLSNGVLNIDISASHENNQIDSNLVNSGTKTHAIESTIETSNLRGILGTDIASAITQLSTKRPARSASNLSVDSEACIATDNNSEEALTASMLQYEKRIEKFSAPVCSTCSRISLLAHEPRTSVNYKCIKCTLTKNKIRDYVKPVPIPEELRKNALTFVEEQLIALVFVQQFVYLRGFGEVASKGHCINFNQDISQIASVLPRLPSELPIVIVKRKSSNDVTNDIKVRRSVILLWLNYLKNNSIVPGYRNVTICEERLNQLPEDGQPEGLTIIETEENVNLDHLQVSCQNESNKNTSTQEKNHETSTEEDFQDENPATVTGVVCPPGRVQKEAESINEFIESLTNAQEMEVDYPAHSQTPLSEFNTPFLASMAFPGLFPTGRGDPFAITNSTEKETLLNKVKNLLYYGEVVENELECRFAQHSRFVMWIHNILYRHKTMSQGNIYLQHNEKDKLLTTTEIKSMIEDGKINQVINNLKRYLANIPGTSSYWQSTHNDLTAIIESKGPPHIFFTHSYADFYDPFLHEFLKIPANSPRNVIHRKLRKYPHLVNWFFIQKFKEFAKQYYIKHLHACPEKGGWLWYRFEWQHRGAIHVHGLLRMGNMPDTYALANKCIAGHSLKSKKNPSTEEIKLIQDGKLAEKELTNLYDALVSCDTTQSNSIAVTCNALNQNAQRPQSIKFSSVDDQDADLESLITGLQRHICRVGGCQKTFNGVLQPCRFDFPKEKCYVTQIKYENKKKNSSDPDKWELSILPKRINDDRIASYNKHQLQHWRANVDFSLVYDYNKVVKYVSKYAAKAETKSNAFKTAFDEIYSNSSSNVNTTQTNLRKVMNKVLGLRDISMHEALHLTMSMDLHWSNITVLKTSLIKSNSIKKSTAGNVEVQPDYLDLYSERGKFVDTYKNIMDLNFIEFVTKFEKKLKQNALVVRKNSSNVALRIHQKFSSNPKNSSYHLYCKYQLLRYKPWSGTPLNAIGDKEESDKLWITQWHEFCNSSLGKDKIPDWRHSIIAQEHIIANDNKENLSDECNSEIDDEEESGELFEDWMRVTCGSLLRNTDTELTSDSIHYWSQDRGMYTSEELFNMKTWLTTQKSELRESPQWTPIDIETLNAEQLCAFNIVRSHMTNDLSSQLLLRLEGTAGTGKSHVINSWCTILEPGTFVIAAPTGRAAHNVNGVTLHSLLSLGTRRWNETISGDSLKRVQERFDNIKYLIIDEYSMVGARMLSIIDKRLRQVTGRPDMLFGGINLILVGDTKQLPPVKDVPLWAQLCADMNEKAKEGLLAFSQFEKVVTLRTIVRQDGPLQRRFRELLLRLRVGLSTIEDYELLSTRINSMTNDAIRFHESIYLMHSNAEVNKYNLEKLSNIASLGNQRICRIDAYHNTAQAKGISADQMLGLEPELILARGARVMLTSNEWTKTGLTNGATGTLRHLIFEENGGPPNLPIAAIVEMDEFYRGPHLENKPRHVVITPKTCSNNEDGKTFERTQLPLKLAFAITIHKSQGMTLNSARVKLGKTENPVGLTFVALSRVRRLEDLLIDYENFESAARITKIKLPQHILEFDKNTERLSAQTMESRTV